MADEQKTVVRGTGDGGNSTGDTFVGIAGKGTSSAVTVFEMSIWKLVAVRVARVYLQSVLGLLTADGMGFVELAKDQNFWGHAQTAGIISIAVAFMSLLQNSVEFLTRLDVDKPGLRA